MSHRVLFLCAFSTASMPKPNKEIKQVYSTIKKYILLLNNLLPNAIGHFWVTSEELYDRLIHAGVSKLLQLAHVTDACRRANTGEKFLAVWKWNNTLWYRSKLVHALDCDKNGDCTKHEVPLEQRHKGQYNSPNLKSTSPQVRININGERDYFVGKNIQELEQLNKALKELEGLDNAAKEAKLSECNECLVIAMKRVHVSNTIMF
jgi:hypothetical protein